MDASRASVERDSAGGTATRAVLIGVGIVLSVIAISAYCVYLAWMRVIVYPNRRAFAESSACYLVRSFNIANDAYFREFGVGYVGDVQKLGGPPENETHGDVNHASLFDPDWSLVADNYNSLRGGRMSRETDSTGHNSFTRRGYVFTYVPASPSFGKVTAYVFTAQPLDYAKTGKRSFYSNQTYVLRVTQDERMADFSDQEISNCVELLTPSPGP